MSYVMPSYYYAYFTGALEITTSGQRCTQQIPATQPTTIYGIIAQVITLKIWSDVLIIIKSVVRIATVLLPVCESERIDNCGLK
jgi:hypothetical protein